MNNEFYRITATLQCGSQIHHFALTDEDFRTNDYDAEVFETETEARSKFDAIDFESLVEQFGDWFDIEISLEKHIICDDDDELEIETIESKKFRIL